MRASCSTLMPRSTVGLDPGVDTSATRLIEAAADPPSKDIHTFIGTFTLRNPPTAEIPSFSDETGPIVSGLTAENVLWANTVLAAGSVVASVIYTGRETRAVMNTSHPETKIGLLDLEINKLAKVGLFRVIFAGQETHVSRSRSFASLHSSFQWLLSL